MLTPRLLIPRLARARRAGSIGGAGFLLLTAGGCQAAEVPPPDEEVQIADWHTAIDTADPLLRRHAVDAILGAPGNDGAAALERAMVADPEARVRERAVIAYGQLRGRDAVALLKDSALSDPSSEVVAAAMGSLARIREEHPEPARGWLDVEFPNAFDVGKPFPIVVRFGSKQAAPRARVELQLPRGFEAAANGATSWSGEVLPGRERELTFMAVASVRDLHSGARVHLKLDYPERLDSEVFHERVRVAVEGENGRFEPQLQPIRRAP